MAELDLGGLWVVDGDLGCWRPVEEKGGGRDFEAMPETLEVVVAAAAAGCAGLDQSDKNVHWCLMLESVRLRACSWAVTEMNKLVSKASTAAVVQ